MTSSVAISLLGAKTFMRDKSNGIMEYSSGQVRLAAEGIEHLITDVLWTSRAVHLYTASSDKRGLERFYDDLSRSLKVKQLLVITLGKDGDLKPFAAYGDQDGTLIHTLDQLGWDHSRFMNDHVLLAKAAPNTLAVGTLVRLPEGGGTGIVYFITPEVSISDVYRGFTIYLIDQIGNILFTNADPTHQVGRNLLVELTKSLQDEKEKAGTRHVNLQHELHIAAYQKLDFRELSVVSFVPESKVLEAVDSLFLRSITIGLGVLSLTIGILLLLTNRITRALRGMAVITEKVRDGVYHYRIDTKGMGNDELGHLMTSFNLMAGQINTLIQEATQKVQVLNDSAIEEVVRTSLNPQRSVDVGPIHVSGRTFYTRVCGGDWWYCQGVEGYVLFGVGELEVRAVEATVALSILNGAAACYREMLEMNPVETPDIRSFSGALNSALFNHTKGGTKLSCLLGVLNVKTGQFEICNFGHSAPIQYHTGENAELVEVDFPILVGHDALGAKASLRPDSTFVPLSAGDHCLIYTSGLFKNYNSRGEKLELKAVEGFLTKANTDYNGRGSDMARYVNDKVFEFSKDGAGELSEDMTTILVSVSKGAQFEEDLAA